ncbi:hypothetical protein BDY21DRAFT_366644 [Lineolata rhizophorae]|uniref:BZIP domain-containing protein n=1 Tax=Lineolata rhizophorae TaxID=578093 RepID=A0A6A6NQF3_9PEZI|nr:hypothetical protein BDY21DRAFT_366644 [Lineolata rhizophorae]
MTFGIFNVARIIMKQQAHLPHRSSPRSDFSARSASRRSANHHGKARAPDAFPEFVAPEELSAFNCGRGGGGNFGEAGAGAFTPAEEEEEGEEAEEPAARERRRRHGFETSSSFALDDNLPPAEAAAHEGITLDEFEYFNEAPAHLSPDQFPSATSSQLPPTTSHPKRHHPSTSTPSISHPAPTRTATAGPSSSKRARNALAARRYRQKHVDRVEQLEAALRGVTRERDGLRLELARKEAEVGLLREVFMVREGRRGGGSGGDSTT